MHGDLDLPVDARERDVDGAAARRELDRVGEQVPDDLLNAVRIERERRVERRELDAKRERLALGLWPDRLDRRFDHGCDIGRLQVEPHLAGDDAVHVEQVLDQARLRLGIPGDRIETFCDAHRVVALEQQHLGPAEDRGERRAQLVRERGEELVLEPAHALAFGARAALDLDQTLLLGGDAARFLVDARVVDRDRSLRGDADDDPLGAGIEHAGSRVAEQQAADRLAAAQLHRHREIASHRQMPRRHAVVRCHPAVPGIEQDVVDAHRRFAPEGRPEQRRHPRRADSLDRRAQCVREGIETERLAAVADPAVEEGAELGPAQLRPGVGDGLQQGIELERRRDRAAGLVEQVEDACLVAQRFLGVLARGDVAIAPDAPDDRTVDVLRPREALEPAAVAQLKGVEVDSVVP